MKTLNSLIKILAIGLFFGILFAGYQYDVEYQHHRYLRAREHGKKLKYQIDLLKQQIQGTNNIQVQLTQQQASFDKAILVLPAAAQFNSYLNSVITTAQTSGLKFTGVSQQALIGHDFYHTVPVQMTIVGMYQQFTQFLQALSTANTLSDWTNWTMVRQEPATTVVVNANGQDALTITATAMFYSYP